MKDAFQSCLQTLDHALSEGQKVGKLSPRHQEFGHVLEIGDGIARVSGLPRVQSEELLQLPGERYGMAFNLDPHEVGMILFHPTEGIEAGETVMRTKRLASVPVGKEMLGRVVNPLGQPLDGKGPIHAEQQLPVERTAPPIMHRAPVSEPLQTGIKVIDALIPIGRGQRQLIVGDRQIGKSSVALDTIINQRDQNVICVYCAIGQRSSALGHALDVLQKAHALDHTVIVASLADDVPGMQYLAPYAATSIGEHFMAQGKDVLVVYDDLTRHAWAYRQLSLLLRRPPGREAYPGDIFYLHSRLLERSTHLRPEFGGGSLTALPIVETQAQDISSYITTNLISITDGQLYLSPLLFQRNVLPAVDVGKSVSRVGGKAQHKLYRDIAGHLRLTYAQFEELEQFSRYGARLDDTRQQAIKHGRRVREVLKQSELAPMTIAAQLIQLVAVQEGLLDQIAITEVPQALDKLAHASSKAFGPIPNVDELNLPVLLDLAENSLA
jgi:F-type H+/Na+-transporting ATPase subunit alpha